MELSSFEKDCIVGIEYFLNLCHASGQLASFDFCSSVSTVAQCPEICTPETLPDLSWAQNMGYAESKLVTEHLCMRAAKAIGIKPRPRRNPPSQAHRLPNEGAVEYLARRLVRQGEDRAQY